MISSVTIIFKESGSKNLIMVRDKTGISNNGDIGIVKRNEVSANA